MELISEAFHRSSQKHGALHLKAVLFLVKHGVGGGGGFGTQGSGVLLGVVPSQVTGEPSNSKFPRQPVLVHIVEALQPLGGVERTEQHPKVTFSVHADLLSCFFSATPHDPVGVGDGCGA